jgi:carbon-monoxide dehydrogenase small subunit
MRFVTVNGRRVGVPEEDFSLSLLTFLRERLDLTGTKNGCEKGACGACTVVVNGTARRSCRLVMEAVLGAEILTIEGLAGEDGSLHPIQQAFVDAGAIQCGFCTPGMVMTTYALLKRKSRPTREEIRRALSGNLCRCTGYIQIMDAVELAAERMRETGFVDRSVTTEGNRA